MSSKINPKAWAILVEDEKTALSLQLAMQKSSWQAGEIMTKSHYKYLEIKYRAEQYLKMFTQHFELFDEVIPKYVEGDKEVILYFKLCIEKRMKPLLALYDINLDKDKPTLKTQFNDRIVEQLRRWEKSEDVYSNTIFNLVKEFDRWNNFRILPKEIQEPSAFKRRVKNAYRKHMKVLTQLTPISIDKIKALFKTTRKPNYFLPLLINRKPEVLRIKANKKTFETFTELSLYLYTDESQAHKYIDQVYAYIVKPDKACTDGLVFWPLYRELIKVAYNYESLQKISPSRRHLELALNKLEYV